MILNPINVAFGRGVAQRRDELGLTQAELAGLTGLSRASIASIEKGRQNVLLHQVYDLANALRLHRVGDLLPARHRLSGNEVEVRVTHGEISDSDAARVKELIAGFVAANKTKPRA